MIKLYSCTSGILTVIRILADNDTERRKELKFSPYFKASRSDDHDVILGEEQIQRLYKIKPPLGSSPKKAAYIGGEIEKLVVESLKMARESEIWTRADFELDYM